MCLLTSGLSFAFRSGIYDSTDCSSQLLNHAAVLVGYGKEKDGSLFWIGQNSFSPAWGEEGYFRIKFDSNLCGLAVTPILPIL